MVSPAEMLPEECWWNRLRVVSRFTVSAILILKDLERFLLLKMRDTGVYVASLVPKWEGDGGICTGLVFKLLQDMGLDVSALIFR